MRDVVERYTDLTGKSALLPRYALGYLGSSMYYPELEKDCDDAILEFIDTTKEEEIPVDGFQLSSGYCAIETEEGIKRCVFTWNKKTFQRSKRFFQTDERPWDLRITKCETGNLAVASKEGRDAGERNVCKSKADQRSRELEHGGAEKVFLLILQSRKREITGKLC